MDSTLKLPARTLVLICAMYAALPAHGQRRDDLVGLINAYRAAPGTCNGRTAIPAAPLTPHPALSGVRIDTGTFLELALERAGYPSERAEALFVSGAADARSAMTAIAARNCGTLLSPEFSSVGARRSGDSWLVILARPAPPSPVARLADLGEVGPTILDAVNRARAAGRSCGDKEFPPAPPVAWNGTLRAAAFAHSADMAGQRYFAHRGKDGRLVADRAAQAGYHWRRIGENIASGQDSPEEAVAGWLDSPGHCANIMDGRYTEMGAAYAISSAGQTPRVYWTQVFGTPR